MTHAAPALLLPAPSPATLASLTVCGHCQACECSRCCGRLAPTVTELADWTARDTLRTCRDCTWRDHADAGVDDGRDGWICEACARHYRPCAGCDAAIPADSDDDVCADCASADETCRDVDRWLTAGGHGR